MTTSGWGRRGCYPINNLTEVFDLAAYHRIASIPKAGMRYAAGVHKPLITHAAQRMSLGNYC